MTKRNVQFQPGIRRLLGLMVIWGTILVTCAASCHADENRKAWDITFFENEQISTDQIPWGFTAGEILLENGQTAFLLTPGTSFQLLLPAGQSLVLEYCIHPWVSSSSNGALARVCAKDQNNQDIITCEIEITDEVKRFVPPENSAVLTVEVLHEEDESGNWSIFMVKNQKSGGVPVSNHQVSRFFRQHG